MEMKKINQASMNLGIFVLMTLYSSVGIFSFPHSVSAATPVTTFLLNGVNQDISVYSGDSFTLQVTNTNAPTVCYYQTYIGTAFSGWIAYPCSTYNTPAAITTASFGFPIGLSYLYFTSCNVACAAVTTHYIAVSPPPQLRLLTITKVSPGRVTGGEAPWLPAIDCGATCSFSWLDVPTKWITITATPPPSTVSAPWAPAGIFVGWSGGGCSGSAPSCTFPMNIARNVTAIFDTIIANAGIGREINLPTNSVTISDASASDADGSVASVLWTQTSGPSTATITNSTTLTPTFSNLSVGSYVFRLTATDNLGRISSNEMNIVVKLASIALVPGELWAMGNNGNGNLGLGYTSSGIKLPTRVGADTWKSVTGGYGNSAGIKSDDTLWTWGDYVYGELGIDYPFPHYSPIEPLPGTNWSSVSAMGQFSTFAIKSDGTLWSWGWNCFWALGRNVGLPYTDCSPNTVSYRTPTQVGTDTNWVSVQSGDTYSMALKSDGSLWAWGRIDTMFGNCFGYVCYGDTPTPTQLFPGTAWRSFAASPYPTGIGIKTDGTLWSWGGNVYGQLGVGDFIDRSSPAQILPGTTWSSVTMGIGFAAAIKSDNTLWTWGYNGYGELGLGITPSVLGYTFNRYPTPMQVLPGTTWSGVSAGNYFMMAVKSDSTLWGWGENYSGQLGVGDTTVQTPRYAPVQVGLRTDWGSVSAADSSALAITSAVIPSTLKICPNSCVSGGTPYNTLSSFSTVPTTLYACYGTGVCTTGDVLVSGTWSTTNSPGNAISLNLANDLILSGTQITITRDNPGAATEDITLSYLTATPVTATASVSCIPFTCSSPSIISQRANYCPSVSNTFDDNCGGLTAACDGTRNCDFNWREIAP